MITKDKKVAGFAGEKNGEDAIVFNQFRELVDNIAYSRGRLIQELMDERNKIKS